MTAVATLHAGNYVDACHLLLVEGLPYAWTDAKSPLREDIVGSSYISGIEIKGGLQVPPSIKIGIDPEKGTGEEHGATFKLTDYDGDLAALFRVQDDSDLTQLGERIKPSDSGATLDTILKANGGGATVDLTSTHVGTEFIDSSNARRGRWIAPSDKPAGLDHPVLDLDGSGTTHELQISPVYSSANPHVFAGRKVALYRLVYDHHVGSTPSFSDQYDGGSMIWFGTMLDRGRIVGQRKWEMQCDGPFSWLRKSLNTARDSSIRKPRAVTSLNTEDGLDETGIAVLFSKQAMATQGEDVTTPYVYYDSQLFGGPADLSGLTDPLAIAQQVSDIVAQAYDGTGAKVSLTAPDNPQDGNNADSVNGQFFSFANDGSKATCQVPEQDLTNAAYMGIMTLVLHEKVWAAMGWDYRQKTEIEKSAVNLEGHGLWVDFRKLDANGGELKHGGYAAPIVAPGPGYIAAVFTTKPIWWDFETDDARDVDNSGKQRHYGRAFPNGTVHLSPLGDQAIALGQDKWYCENANAQGPTTDDVGGSGASDSTGWFLFEGARQITADADPDPYAQVAFCEWNDDGTGSPSEDSDGNIVIKIRYWEDPRIFGIPFSRMSSPWNAPVTGEGSISVRQLGVVGGWKPGKSHPSWEPAWQQLTRLLLSSGTATAWADQNTPATVGSNDPGGSINYYANDLNSADMGLNVPGQWVDWQSIEDEGKALGWHNPLQRTKFAYVGSIQAETVIRSILQQCGWSLTLKKTSTSKVPQFGVQTFFDPISPMDAEIVLTVTDKAGSIEDPQSWIPDQEMRFEGPKDWFFVDARWSPTEDKTTYELKRPARDPGARMRAGNVPYDMVCHGLADLSLWSAGSEMNWETDFYARFQKQAAEFYGRRHFLLTETVSRPQGQYMYPGTIVRIASDSRPANPRGGYGLTNYMARVIGLEMILTGDLAGSYRPTMLVQDAPASTVYFWDGSAYMDGFDTAASIWDFGNDKAGDWLGHGGSETDVVFADEPSWSASGGTCKIEVYQSFDGGDTWGDVVTANVSSVDTANHRITVSSISGTLYRDTDKICWLQDADAHASSDWPRAIYTVVTEADGDYGASSTEGVRLV